MLAVTESPCRLSRLAALVALAALAAFAFRWSISALVLNCSNSLHSYKIDAVRSRGTHLAQGMSGALSQKHRGRKAAGGQGTAALFAARKPWPPRRDLELCRSGLASSSRLDSSAGR